MLMSFMVCSVLMLQFILTLILGLLIPLMFPVLTLLVPCLWNSWFIILICFVMLCLLSMMVLGRKIPLRLICIIELRKFQVCLFMVKILDTNKVEVKRRKQVFVPDFSDLNRIYSTGVAMNDIDIALRKRELQETISSMLFDVEKPQPPSLPDDLLMETYVGKELETSDLYAYCKHLEGEILKQRKEDS